MGKGQSLIIQFMFFFMIGFSVFLGIGTFFRMRSEMLKGDIFSRNTKLVGSYISSMVITLKSCKFCDYSRVYLSLPTPYYLLSLEGNKLEVSSPPPNEKRYTSSLHNLNFSLSLEGSAISGETITLTLDRTKNKLAVG